MVKYSVVIRETIAGEIEVETETKEEAIQKVRQMIEAWDGPFLFNIEDIESDRELFFAGRNLYVKNGFRVKFTDSEGSESIEEWPREDQAEDRIKGEMECYDEYESLYYEVKTKTTILYDEKTGRFAKWQRLW